MQWTFRAHDNDSTMQLLTTVQTKVVCVPGRSSTSTPFIATRKPQMTKKAFATNGNQLTCIFRYVHFIAPPLLTIS